MHTATTVSRAHLKIMFLSNLDQNPQQFQISFLFVFDLSYDRLDSVTLSTTKAGKRFFQHPLGIEFHISSKIQLHINTLKHVDIFLATTDRRFWIVIYSFKINSNDHRVQ